MLTTLKCLDTMKYIRKQLNDGIYLFGWKSDPPLTPVAPSYSYYFTEKRIFSEEECRSWYDFLLELEPILLDKYRIPAGDAGTGLGPNSLTSRYPYYNVLDFDFHLIPKLKTEIFNGIKTILSISNNTKWRETIHAKSWFNVLRQGEEMAPHCHGFHEHIFYGFHLTIGSSETFNTYYHPLTFPFQQDNAFHVPNKVGCLTLFPDLVPHGVSPNKHSVPRISIAGDIFTSLMLKTNRLQLDVNNDSDKQMDTTELGKT